jgi:hypothetical protein
MYTDWGLTNDRRLCYSRTNTKGSSVNAILRNSYYYFYFFGSESELLIAD